MTIDSTAVVLIALAATLAASSLVAYLWDGRRVAGRIVLAAGVVLAVAATAALQLNRLTETIPDWSALLGGSAATHPRSPEIPRHGDSADQPEPPAGSGGGRLVTFTVPGTASRMTMPMAVYLPGAYNTPDGRKLRFPVIEALHGFPGTPDAWTRRLGVKRYLDQEIAAGRMAPTVVIFPYQTPNGLLDTECTNLVGGPQAETYLVRDVPQWTRDHLRVRPDRDGWALVGFSAGAFCAMNLALRHPDRYAAGASLSGYANPGITIGDGSERTTNSIVWRLTHLPPPAVSLYIAWADDDKGSSNSSRVIARMARAPLAVTTGHLPHGGHSLAVWRRMEGPAFDWLSAHLARTEPAAPASKAPGKRPPGPAPGGEVVVQAGSPLSPQLGLRIGSASQPVLPLT